MIWNRVPHFALETKWPIQNVVDNVFVLFSSKWRLSAKHDEHNDSHRPYITLCRITSLENLWCNIVWRTIRLVHNLIRHNSFGQTEIYQLNMRVIIFLVQQKILWLNISMANTILVQVAEGIKCLFHDTWGLLLSKMLFLSNMIKKFATLTQSTKMKKIKIKLIKGNLLSDEETNSISLPGFEKLNDVWMVLKIKKINDIIKLFNTYQCSKNSDLVLERFIIWNSWLLHGFNCNFFAYKKKIWLIQCFLFLLVCLFLARYTAPYPPLPIFFSKKYFSLIFPTRLSMKIDLVICFGACPSFDLCRI